MKILYLLCVVLSAAGCSGSLRTTSNGSLPEVPARLRVLLIPQDADAQRFVQEVSRSLELVGMEPYLDGSVLRAIDGPDRIVRTGDTTFQSRTQVPYTTTLYPTPNTELTLLLAASLVSWSRYVINLNFVDSKTGRLWYSMTMTSPNINNLSSFTSALNKELRIAQARGRGVASGEL